MKKFLPDDRIGAYRIVRPLGMGGMGAVYEVVHEKLGVHYALKAFTLDHGHVNLLKERFLAEGRVLARLHHPNLVRVFDLDVDEASQTVYFVMDLVLCGDGKPRTLADVEDGSADETQLSRWFGQLASALDHIHDKGIVHRDIKLGNILLDARGGVVLSDFGVSRICDGQLRQDLRLDRTTISGEAATGSLVMGTSGYMAPEVKRGEDATAASDAYSLGIVFFRLLTGIWYENRPNIWGLLEPFDAAWQTVLQGLLAENPAERPVRLVRSAEKLKEHGVTSGRHARWLPAVVSLAGMTLAIVAWMAWRSFHVATVRTDDLFAVPAAAPEN